jgi:hypothetical protein
MSLQVSCSIGFANTGASHGICPVRRESLNCFLLESIPVGEESAYSHAENN